MGRQWKIETTFERPPEGSTFDVDSKVVVAKLEEVVVPAGKFKAFKIEVYSRSQNLQYEYWYSPKVKEEDARDWADVQEILASA